MSAHDFLSIRVDIAVTEERLDQIGTDRDPFAVFDQVASEVHAAINEQGLTPQLRVRYGTIDEDEVVLEQDPYEIDVHAIEETGDWIRETINDVFAEQLKGTVA